MTRRKFQVRHPDGTVSTRTTEKKTYPFAIVAGPETREARIAYHEREAERLGREAAIREAAANRAEVKVVSRGFRSPEGHHDHEASLVGSGIERDAHDRKHRTYMDSIHHYANADGKVRVYRQFYNGPGEPDGDARFVIADARDYLVEKAREWAAGARNQAREHLEKARAYAEGREQPAADYFVVCWAGRADLAEARVGGPEARYHREFGRTVKVVPTEEVVKK